MLSGVDKYMEFTMGVRLIFTKLQVVNTHLVFKPVNPRNTPLLKPADISFCHTEMGEHIKVSGGKKSFKMKKTRRGDNNNGGDDEELQDPEVYFAFAVSTDKLYTLELVNQVGASWGMIGGNKS